MKNLFYFYAAVSLVCILITENSYSQVELNPAAGVNFNSYSQDPEAGTTLARVGWQFGGKISFSSWI